LFRTDGQQFQSEEPSARNGSKTLEIFCDKDAAYEEEIICVLKSLQASMSAASCDKIINVFNAMFSGKLPSEMSMSVEKAMYLITDVRHSHCKQSPMKDLVEAYFVLEYDGTTYY